MLVIGSDSGTRVLVANDVAAYFTKLGSTINGLFNCSTRDPGVSAQVLRLSSMAKPVLSMERVSLTMVIPGSYLIPCLSLVLQLSYHCLYTCYARWRARRRGYEFSRPLEPVPVL